MLWALLREAFRDRRMRKALQQEPEAEWLLTPRRKIELAGAILSDRGYRFLDDRLDPDTLAKRITEILAAMPPQESARIIEHWQAVCGNISACRTAKFGKAA